MLTGTATNFSKIKWKSISTDQRLTYCELVQNRLKCQSELCMVQGCRETKCQSNITDNFNKFKSALLSCANSAFDNKKCQPRFQKQGWNDFIKNSYDDYRAAFLLWRESGSVRSDFYETMNKKRKLFKYSLCKCRRDEQRRVKDNLALSYKGKDFKQFWEHVKKEEQVKCSTVDCVDDISGDKEIREHWASLYSKIFNANQGNEDEKHVDNYIAQSSSKVTISESCILECILKLKGNKACGSEGLQAEHYKIVARIITPCVTSLINSMFAHGFVPEEVMTVTIVPIPKKKGVDESKSANYRPIALASIFSKILELIILEEYPKLFLTTDNQFGYKKKIGTEMAIYVVKQVSHYYLRRNTPVYACFLDATKAFDYVNHFVLLKKLCDRGFPPIVINILKYWFRNQTFVVRWKSGFSSPFSVLNSCRQGGILSGYFFAIYTDELSKELTASGLGCHVGSKTVNHTIFADDVCILTSSISALRKLLTICENYADKHYISFNPKKTVCMCFSENTEFYSVKPSIKLCGEDIVWVDTFRYLGFDIACGNKDVDEVLRRRREFYARANLIKSKF